MVEKKERGRGTSDTWWYSIGAARFDQIVSDARVSLETNAPPDSGGTPFC